MQPPSCLPWSPQFFPPFPASYFQENTSKSETPRIRFVCPSCLSLGLFQRGDPGIQVIPVPGAQTRRDGQNPTPPCGLSRLQIQAWPCTSGQLGVPSTELHEMCVEEDRRGLQRDSHPGQEGPAVSSVLQPPECPARKAPHVCSYHPQKPPFSPSAGRSHSIRSIFLHVP